MLARLIMTHRQEIIARLRAKAVARSVPQLSDGALDQGIPIFLDQLSESLHATSPSEPRTAQMGKGCVFTLALEKLASTASGSRTKAVRAGSGDTGTGSSPASVE